MFQKWEALPCPLYGRAYWTGKDDELLEDDVILILYSLTNNQLFYMDVDGNVFTFKHLSRLRTVL